MSPTVTVRRSNLCQQYMQKAARCARRLAQGNMCMTCTVTVARACLLLGAVGWAQGTSIFCADTALAQAPPRICDAAQRVQPAAGRSWPSPALRPPSIAGAGAGWAQS